MSFSSSISSDYPRAFSVGPLRAEIHSYSAASGDTAGTLTALGLSEVQQVLFGSGNIQRSAADVISGRSVTLAFVCPTSAAATLEVQDLTYTAVAEDNTGNLISIEYTDGASQGAEVVSVDGNAISVQIEDGVSTATQIKAAIDASVEALALVSVAVTGTGSNAQEIVEATPLSGGVTGGARGHVLLLGK